MEKGITLLELLIVVAIIAVLAGVAMPYVQHYLDEARLSRTKQDLDEIRRALVRYEIANPHLYSKPDLSDLIGPYLGKGMVDPWGNPYRVNSQKSICFSPGPDRQEYTADDIAVDFRPPLAIAKAYHEDANRNAVVDTGDRLVLKFTRPIRTNPGDGPSLAVANDDLLYSFGHPGNDYPPPLDVQNNKMTVRLKLDFGGNPPFRPGRDTVTAKEGNSIVDADGKRCRADQPTIIQPMP